MLWMNWEAYRKGTHLSVTRPAFYLGYPFHYFLVSSHTVVFSTVFEEEETERQIYS